MEHLNLDNSILRDVLHQLPKETLEEIRRKFEKDVQYLDRLNEILDENPRDQISSSDTNEDIVKKWEKEKVKFGNKFQTLMKKYMDQYLKNERNGMFEPSRAYLENLVSNHSKWNRMMNHNGQGRQYRDDLRRVCFVFRLTFPEANELLMSAGQLFDLGDLRDYILIDCLNRKIYSMEKVDEILSKAGVSVLFPAD